MLKRANKYFDRVTEEVCTRVIGENNCHTRLSLLRSVGVCVCACIDLLVYCM